MKKMQELNDLNVLHQASKRLYVLSELDISKQYKETFHSLEDILKDLSPTLGVIVYPHYNPILVCIYEYDLGQDLTNKIEIENFKIKKISDDIDLKIVKIVENFLMSLK